MYRFKTRLENTKFLLRSQNNIEINNMAVWSLDKEHFNLFKDVFSLDDWIVILCQKNYLVYYYANQESVNVINLDTKEKKELNVGDIARVFEETLVGKTYNSDYSRCNLKMINLRTGLEGIYEDLSDYTLRFHQLKGQELIVDTHNKTKLICYNIIDEKRLEEKWHFQLEDGIKIGCFLGEIRNQYLFTFHDSRILFLDKESGRCIDEIKSPEVHLMPSINVLDQIHLDLIREEIIYTCGLSYLYSIDLKNKQVKVTYLKLKEYPERAYLTRNDFSVDEDYIYGRGIYNRDLTVINYDELREFYLYIISRETLEIIWEYRLPDFKDYGRTIGKPIIEGDELYFEFDGDLYIFEKEMPV